jgi:hypothetical protein
MVDTAEGLCACYSSNPTSDRAINVSHIEEDKETVCVESDAMYEESKF